VEFTQEHVKLLIEKASAAPLKDLAEALQLVQALQSFTAFYNASLTPPEAPSSIAPPDCAPSVP
jgi:hypothetical protein